MTKKTGEIKFKVNSQTTVRELKGRVYLFDPEKMELHSFNETASFIWRKAQNPLGLKTLIKLVCQEFDVQEKVATEDVRSFVKYCLNKKIFRRVNP